MNMFRFVQMSIAAAGIFASGCVDTSKPPPQVPVAQPSPPQPGAQPQKPGPQVATAEVLTTMPRADACVVIVKHMSSCRNALLWRARTTVALHGDPQEAMSRSHDLDALFERVPEQHCLSDAAKQGHDEAVACYSDDCETFSACVLGGIERKFGPVERAPNDALPCPVSAHPVRALAGGKQETLMCVEDDGRPQGPFIRRHPNGKKGFEATFVDGVLHGQLNGWDATGKHISQFTAVRGEGQGEAWSVSPDGEFKFVTTWDKGVKQRVETYRDGKLVEREVLRDGTMIQETVAP